MDNANIELTVQFQTHYTHRDASDVPANGSAHGGYRRTGRSRLPGVLRVLLLQTRKDLPGIRAAGTACHSRKDATTAPRESVRNIPASRTCGPSHRKPSPPSRPSPVTSTGSPSAAAATPAATRSLRISSSCLVQQERLSISGTPAARAGTTKRSPTS